MVMTEKNIMSMRAQEKFKALKSSPSYSIGNIINMSLLAPIVTRDQFELQASVRIWDRTNEIRAYFVEIFQAIFNNVDRFVEIFLRDDQRRSEADAEWRVRIRNRTVTLFEAHMFTCVGFASTPLLLSKRQNCQAVRPRWLCDSSMTTALSNPLPRTSFTRGEFISRIADRKRLPSSIAR